MRRGGAGVYPEGRSRGRREPLTRLGGGGSPGIFQVHVFSPQEHGWPRKKMIDGEIMKIDQASMMNGLDWAYDQAVNGIPFLKSAEDIGNEYTQAHTAGTDSLEACAKRLVRWQMSKAGTSGFLSGIGGVLTLPVAIPANLASVMFVQIRMIAAIAHLGGTRSIRARCKSRPSASLAHGTGTCARRMQDIESDTGYDTRRCSSDGGLALMSQTTVCDTC